MQHDTETGTPQNSPRAFGWCAWHRGNAENVRLIDVHEQGSGPGGNLFACEPCREAHHLVPLADLPL